MIAAIGMTRSYSGHPPRPNLPFYLKARAVRLGSRQIERSALVFPALDVQIDLVAVIHTRCLNEIRAPAHEEARVAAVAEASAADRPRVVRTGQEASRITFSVTLPKT